MANCTYWAEIWIINVHLRRKNRELWQSYNNFSDFAIATAAYSFFFLKNMVHFYCFFFLFINLFQVVRSGQAQRDWMVHFCLSLMVVGREVLWHCWKHGGQILMDIVAVLIPHRLPTIKQRMMEWRKYRQLWHVTRSCTSLCRNGTSKQILQLSRLIFERAEGWISPLNVPALWPLLKTEIKVFKSLGDKSYWGLCQTWFLITMSCFEKLDEYGLSRFF